MKNVPMIYHETEHGTIYCGDSLDVLKSMADESVDLVLTDPPYNIDKVRNWDKWNSRESYISWCGEWIRECVRVLKDNGSFYFFHNDMPQIAMLMEWIRVNTPLVFKQFIVWNKRFEGSPNKGYMDGYCAVENLRNYKKMAEYCLFYTFQDQTGLSNVYDDVNCFTEIKEYLRSQRRLFADYNKVKLTDADCLLGELTKTATMVRHYWGNVQWCFPTKEIYLLLQSTGFWRREYEDLRREYEDLRREYEDLRYTFNNQKTHHSVWNYDFAPKQGHITPKPVDLIRNIIKHSTNKGDTVLDPFLGSGTTAIAAVLEGRDWIGIEREAEYCDIAAKRIDGELQQANIFKEMSGK